MKYTILIFIFLTGCSTFGSKPDNTSSQNVVDNQNGTGINPYVVNEFPTPQQKLIRCVEGRIDEIISGNEATTIWYVTTAQIGLQSFRLPHTFPVKIKMAEGAFCFDYFDVSFKQKTFDTR